MITLRQYQLNLINDIRSRMRQGHNNIVAQSPTGSGKTVIFSYIVKQASERGNRCLILTNRIELLEQAGGTFENFQIPFSNITAKTRHIPNSRVLVAMVETIKRRCASRLDFQILLRSIDLLIIDECHIAAFDPIFAYLKPECYVIGATATPIRQNSKKPLSNNFTSLVTGPEIWSLILSGYLAKPFYKGIKVDIDESKENMKSGDFSEEYQNKIYSDIKLYSGLKHNLSKYAKGLKTMIFCPSVQSSLNVAQELGCLHVDGTMAPEQRDKVLTEFENTPGAVLTNCAITTTGYDHPEIECIVLYRATTSLPLFLQMVGRGSRVTPTKRTFTILDFGMNVQRFGYWHIDRVWSLDQPKKKKSKKKDVFPIKFCPGCGAIVAVNTKTCPECGYVWPVTEKERVFAELSELSYEQVQKRMSEASIEEMETIRVAKGYKVGYLLHRFSERSEFEEYARLKGYNPKWVDHQVKIYLENVATN